MEPKEIDHATRPDVDGCCGLDDPLAGRRYGKPWRATQLHGHRDFRHGRPGHPGNGGRTARAILRVKALTFD